MYPGPSSNHAPPDMSARLYMMYGKVPARAPRLGSTINSELRLPWRNCSSPTPVPPLMPHLTLTSDEAYFILDVIFVGFHIYEGESEANKCITIT
jgi:hypothetical protein